MLSGFGRGSLANKPGEAAPGFCNGDSCDSGFGSGASSGFNSSSSGSGFGFGSGFGSGGGSGNGGGGGGFGGSSGFGGSGGFGGGGGGSDDRPKRQGGCFNCGQSGHMSKDCTEPRKPRGDGGSGDRPRGCFNCGQSGHMSKDCSEPRKPRERNTEGGGGGFGGGSAGFGSGGGGGFGGGGGGGSGFGGGGGSSDDRPRSRGCFNCGQSGHMSKDCPEPRKPREPRGNDGSGSFGASSGFGGDGSGFGNDAGSGFGGGGGGSSGFSGSGDGAASERPRSQGCFNCGQTGHMSRDCPEPRKPRPMGRGDGGAPPRDDDDAGGEDVRKPVTYVPKEKTYEELEGAGRISSGINFEKYGDIKVDVTCKSCSYRPIESFDEAGLTETVLANVARLNWKKPTPIQKHAIPIINAGFDLMACAQTGSGKTGAFLLPILTEMLRKDDLSTEHCEFQEPRAVIMTPTRELAIQISEEAKLFARDTMVKVCLAYGGTSVRHQCEQIRKGCNILVATPGRLKQFIEESRIGLKKVRYFILDEADRMLDMGFEPDVRRVAEHATMPLKTDRQTLMFSATFPSEIQQLAADFLRPDFPFVAVGIVGAANADIQQNIEKMDAYAKKDRLIELLQADIENCKPNADGKYTKKTLVFVERKRTADFLASLLSQKNVFSTSIHSDRDQAQREQALNDFKYGRCPVLVATSVAARGLDIVGVDHVINYDLPKQIDDYVHRIGRTGRVGNPGRATSFYEESSDGALMKDLVKILADALQVVPDWMQGGASYVGGGGGGSFNSFDNFGSNSAASTWD